MMNKLGLIIVSVILALIQTGCAEQSTWMSLNSSNPRIIWEVKPQADLENITGEQISTPEFKMSDYVKGVVPGTVFTAYVEAGIVPDPNYADNIYKVDETFYNRPFWYRTEFELPSSYSEGKRVWLHFDNTNRFADFYFNGEKISGTKLLQKSEMRKNMVMDLIYRGFIYAANYSESHYNPRRSQIKTELRYLFVTTLNR